MKRLFAFILLIFTALSFSEDLKGLKDFFERKGYVIEKLGNKIIVDLGKGKANVGEVLSVIKKGKKLVHPVTGEVLGTVDEEVGKVRISEVRDKFSVADILEDRGIEKGAQVKLYYESVCFVGSEEGYFKVSSLIGGVRKGESCDYVIREFDDGFGIEYKGSGIAFFEKPKPAVFQPAVEKTYKPEEFILKAKFVITFPGLPLSADTCNLFGNEKDYLAVLFEGSLKIYEILNKEIVEYADVKMPSGYPISVQCAPLESGKDVILVNMISAGSASSLLIKIVGGTPVIVRKNIPYIMAVLDKNRPKETFVGQIFNSRDLWGDVRRLELKGDDVIEKETFPVPSGFRIDSALMFGDWLIFTDRDGYLRVFKGDEMVFSEGDFSGSYTTAELPETYEDTDRYTFNPRPFTVKVLNKEYAGVIRNVTSPIYRFLDVKKFAEGEIYLIVEGRKGIAQLKKVRGKKFEEDVQAVVRTRNGRLFVITGRTGTLPLQNRGDLFEVEINPL